VYVRLLGRSRSVIAGLLQATSLTFTVSAAQIGIQLGVVTQDTAAGLVAAGLLSVVISPALALALLCREQPDQRSKPAGQPSAAAAPARPNPTASGRPS
jgi:hypothetical protein